MKVRESQHDQIHVFDLDGEVDLQNARALRSLFQSKADRHCPVLFLDLSAVSFIDSTGIAALIEYLGNATEFGGKFCIAGMSDHVRNIFQIVQLHKAISMFNNLDEAKAALRSDAVPTPVQPLSDTGDGISRNTQVRPEIDPAVFADNRS
jgi:anti-sigma B factor antagonist